MYLTIYSKDLIKLPQKKLRDTKIHTIHINDIHVKLYLGVSQFIIFTCALKTKKV